jgi:hypothetical protein
VIIAQKEKDLEKFKQNKEIEMQKQVIVVLLLFKVANKIFYDGFLL